MSAIPLHLKLKFGQAVWHDQPYISLQRNELTEMDFYDHIEPVHRAFTILQEPTANIPVIIIGERRAGKTSLLKLLLDKLSKEPHFISIEIPWLGINSAAKLMEEFLESLFMVLDPEDKELQKEIRQVNDLRDFQATMIKILAYKPDAVVVYGIDELDSILEDQVTDSAGQAEIIRLINSLNDTTTLPVKLILSTTRELEKFGTDYLLKAKAEHIRLDPFSASDLNAMTIGILGKDFSITEEEQETIYTLSGGWPYWAKALLYHLVQSPPDDQRIQQARMKATQSVSATWEHIYEKHWDDEYQRALILFIAQHNGQIKTDQIRIHNKFATALRNLSERGYILQSQKGYQFRIQLLQDWLSQWVRFEEELQKYHGLLKSLTPKQDPWVTVEDNEMIEVSKEDLRRRGF